jgi:S-adenosylmethionine:tRNA ribosyltransferase-isomerase
LLVIDPDSETWSHACVADLARLLHPRDVLVVNDAATVPASLLATTADGTPVEIRLAAALDSTRWRAITFGAGDWRTPTENRPAPVTLRPGDALLFAPGLQAQVESVDPQTPRLVILGFAGGADALWAALYRHGRPVQYAHVARPLEIWHVQTPFAAQPWAVEMPSAGRPLAWSLVRELQSRGVRVCALTHAAGLSSTGDPVLDARLPLPERFAIPAHTAAAVRTARDEGGRIIAVGTTVVRAIEGSAERHGGDLLASEEITDLRIRQGFTPRIVDGLVTGMHAPGSSHWDLETAFATEPLLRRAWADAEARGYLEHEFGDTCIVLPRAA